MSSVQDIERKHWDYLVVGTGIGGATLGYALAVAGRSVLFVERGRVPSRHPDTLRGSYPELRFPRVEAAAPRHSSLLAQAGRCSEEILDGRRAFVPFTGCGGGGSSALYGMAMERFSPADFTPGTAFQDRTGSTVPAAWPVDYEALAPFYLKAEDLYRVKGGRDPLRPTATSLPAAPAMSPRGAELFTHFQHQGLHPYALPMACEAVPGCACCQGFLCAHDCKNDSGRICLEPALRDHEAGLLDECEVLRLEATGDRVVGVVCRSGNASITLRSDQVILAAGALATPVILLRSASPSWPDGLANRSGQVGRNLMRHCVDLYLIFTRSRGENRLKEVALNDLYQVNGRKLGTVQSFGQLPPTSILVATWNRDTRAAMPWAAPLAWAVQPLLRAGLSCLLGRGILLASIMEDLPYADNRVVPGPPVAIRYRVSPQDLERLRFFRARVGQILQPYRFLALREGEKNSMLAHACGTCRFGEDPSASVLDPHNRAHGIRNLYVVDSSFFPSSGGTNPALTIAANALRVAEHILRRNA